MFRDGDFYQNLSYFMTVTIYDSWFTANTTDITSFTCSRYTAAIRAYDPYIDRKK